MIELQAAGLNATEAKCYEALLAVPDCKPSELAKIVNETRTNCYKILDKLVSMELVERLDNGPTLRYRAMNPTRLLELAHQQRIAQTRAEEQLEAKVHGLLDTYNKINGQPGIRYYSGKDGIREIFADQVKAGKPIFFVHTIAGIDFYSYEQMHDIRMMLVNAGIPRYALTPDTSLAHVNYKVTDKMALLTRTWMSEDDYTAPVEWGAYGNKLYIISYGEEAMGMTIESVQIAEAFRQLFALLDRGQRTQPWYRELPRRARKVARIV